MARVPRLITQQVAPRALPIPQAPTNFSGEEFGAGVFEAIGAIAAQETAKAHATAASKVELSALGLVKEKKHGKSLEDGSFQVGLLDMQGDQLFASAGAAPAELKADLYALLDGMAPGAREIAQPRLDRLLVGFGESLSSHEAVAREVHHNAVFKAQMGGIANSALALMAEVKPDPTRVVEAGELGKVAIAEHAKTNGAYIGEKKTDWIASQQKAFLTSLYTGAVKVLVEEGKHEEALTLQEALEDMGGDFIDTKASQASRKNVDGSMRFADIQGVAEELLVEFPVDVSGDSQPAKASADAVKAARKTAKDLGWSPEDQDGAAQYVEQRFAKATAEAKAVQAEGASVLRAKVVANGGSMSMIELKKKDRALWDSLSQTQQQLLTADARTLREGWDETNAQVLFDTLKNDYALSDDPSERQDFLDADLSQYAVQLGTYYDKLVKYRDGLRDGLGGVMSTKDQVSSAVDSYYGKLKATSSDAERERVRLMRFELDEILERATAEKKAPLTSPETRKILDGIVADKVLHKDSGFIGIGTNAMISLADIAKDDGVDLSDLQRAFRDLTKRRNRTGQDITKSELVALAEAFGVSP